MLKKHFLPYKELIMKCINSSTTAEHLHVCRDMMFSFSQHFRNVKEISGDELGAAADEMISSQLQKEHEING